MANVKSGNSWYVDSTGALGGSASYVSVNVYVIVVSSTGSAGSIVLQDAATDVAKIRINVPADETREIYFEEKPLNFAGGIEITSISNCVATLLVVSTGG